MANEAGQGCADRGSTLTGYTMVSQSAASVSGSVTKLSCYVDFTGGAGALKFRFYTVDGDTCTPVDGTLVSVTPAQTAGCQEFEAGVDFTAFDVEAGQYLGCYVEQKQTYADAGGTGFWYKNGDYSEAPFVGDDSADDYLDGMSADISAAGGSVVPIIATIQRRRRG